MKYPLDYTAKIRVPYYFTDQMGVVWHGNYLKFFEDAREELFRHFGLPYSELEKTGVIMPAIAASMRYIRPVRYDDVISVRVLVSAPPRAKMEFAYEVRDGVGNLCTTGATTLTFVSAKTGAPCRPPAILLGNG